MILIAESISHLENGNVKRIIIYNIMKKCATCGSVKMKAGGAKKMGMGGIHMMPDGSMMKDSMMKAGGAKKKFPDLTGDGKVTMKDILKGRGVIKKKSSKK